MTGSGQRNTEVGKENDASLFSVNGEGGTEGATGAPRVPLTDWSQILVMLSKDQEFKWGIGLKIRYSS